ncbi:AraC family transcriptional regulator [Alteromonas gracilis]
MYSHFMAAPLRLPVRTGITTRQPADVHDWLGSLYAPGTLHVAAGRGAFELRGERLRSDGLAIDWIAHTGQISGLVLPGDVVRIFEIVRGTLLMGRSPTALRVDAGEAVLLSGSAPLPTTMDGVKARVVSVDRDLLRTHIADHLGIDEVDVHLDTRTTESPARTHQWQQAIRFLETGVLTNPEVATTSQALEDSWRLLSSVLLQAFPQTGLGPSIPRRAGGSISAPVRRAITFMHHEAHRPISIAEVAEAAHLTVRGTEAAFRRNLQTTPLAYLRRVRLAQAHQELLSADPSDGTTVAMVASRWGFAHQGRFSAQYREVYGVTPRQTLWN